MMLCGCFEARRLLKFQAHIDAKQHEHETQQERDSPSPRQELGVGHSCDDGHRQRGEDYTHGAGCLNHAAEESASSCGRAFDGQQQRADRLAAERKSLQEPQAHQKDRRPDADLVIRREQSDRRSADAHQQQRDHQNRFAADSIAEVAKDDPP